MGVLRLVEDTAATVELYPDVLPASGTLTLYKPGGTSLATPTVTVDSVDTTINAAPTSQTQISVADATGITVGRYYWWQSQDSGAHGAPVLVSEIDGTDIILESPPPGTLKNGDAIKGLRCTAPLTATHTADRGRNYRLDWIITDGSGVTHPYRQIVDVVRTKFRDPVTAAEAARYISGLYANWAGTNQDAGRYTELAARASEHVLDRIRAREFSADLFGDQDAFKRAGLVALRIELYHAGMSHPAEDAAGYYEAQEQELERQIDQAIAGCWYDRDDSGGYDATTEKERGHSIRLVRV